MSAFIPERRRSPRVSMQGGPPMTVTRTLRVRLMEISADGALLAAEEPLAVRASGRLFTNLGGQRFEADMSVRRVDGNRVPALHGVVIVPTEQRDRQALDDFLQKAGA